MMAAADRPNGLELSLRGEIARLERRVLEEARSHDATRHRLKCRERELERLRDNFYSRRVEGATEEERAVFNWMMVYNLSLDEAQGLWRKQHGG
jgi:hypothetical protein